MRFLICFLVLSSAAAAQDPPPLRPGRLMLSTGNYEDYNRLPAAPRVVQGKAYYPHQIPYVYQPPASPPKQVSNQDISDGVRRPDDLLRTPFIDPSANDYFSEFRNRGGK